MLTFEGKQHIKRYLAGWVPAIAQSVAFGVGTKNENASDTALQVETARSPINLTSYDFAGNTLVYKAAIPEDYIGKIYEVGLYSLPDDPASAGFGSRVITSFDSESEAWVDPLTDNVSDFASTSTRVGNDSLKHSPSASATETSALREIQLDLSGNSSADSFTFVYNVANANTNQIVFRFLTDSSNYYSFNMGAQTAGYKIVEAAKGTATVTGSPSWETITQIQIITTSKPAGASNVEFEIIRIEDKDNQSLDYILVARKVLSSPITAVDGMAQDIEFTLDVTI